MRLSVGWPWFVMAAAVGVAVPASAQPARAIEEPRWLRLNFREVSTGVYAEGQFEETSLQGSDAKVSYERVFVGPLLGLNLDGSVYHSNLLRYTFISEGSLGWGYEDIRSGTLEHRDEIDYLGRFNCAGTFLNEKPYATTIFGDYDHTYRDYDFFSRVIVDSWRYGLNSGYSEGPVPVTVSYWHRDEDIHGYAGPTSTREDVLNLLARHDRESGHSQFNYTFNQYGRTDLGDTGAGSDHTFLLSDTEHFGSRRQYELYSGIGYSHRESDFETSDEYTASANLKAEYTPDLTSRCDFNSDRYRTGTFESDTYLGHGELQHQLYDSLTTTLIGEGSYYAFSDVGGSSETTRYGPGLGLSYTKHLGAVSRLQMDNTVMYTHSDVENTGALGTVFDERHSFAASGAAPPDSFFLNQPRVIESTVTVTGDLNDPNGALFRYQENLDYTVRRSGLLTLIERVPGSRISPGQTLLVDYRYVAAPSGSYQTLNDSFHIRFSLWENLWGLYTRLNVVANDAPPELLVQDLNIYTFGTDVAWRIFRAGAEYEVYDSNLSNYRTTRLFQSVGFRPDDESSLGLDFTQSWTDYVDADRTEERYSFIARYHRSFTWRLGLDLDAGLLLRRGEGMDQTLATCRPGIQYTYGKTSIKAGYDFEYELYLDSEERTKHMFFVRLKRVF